MSDLRGLRILVTREKNKAEETAAAIRARGGFPVVFPTIEIVPPEDLGPLRDAAARLREFDWVAVPSATAASVLADACRELGLSLAPIQFAAVGEETARMLRNAGARKVRIPSRQDGAGLASDLAAAVSGGRRVLVPMAEGGRPELVEGLKTAGASVVTVIAYRTRTRRPGPGELATLLSGPGPDAAVFFSPSAFDGFVETLGPDRAIRYLKGMTLGAIGRTTAEAIRRRGLREVRMARRPTIEDLLDCLSESRGSPSAAD